MAPGLMLEFEIIPVSLNIWDDPEAYAVKVSISPWKFLRKIKSILTKSARAVPMFCNSPFKIVLPDLSLDSIISPSKIIDADDCCFLLSINAASSNIFDS